jgi:tRNA pseudouridine55 synthase
MASGLLVVALGKCTRLLEYLPLEPKVYEFSVVFGKSTDTLDAEGNVVAESGVIPSESQLIDALKGFTGWIEQVPPQYSAIKIGGTPAYRLARRGVDVAMKPRVVTIYAVELRGYDKDEKRADFTVSCSAGTYVRSLAVDVTKAADAGAEGFVSRLRRTRTGRFDLSMAANFQSLPDAINYIIDAEDAVNPTQKVVIDDRLKAEVSSGRAVVIDRREGGTLIAFDGAGALSAVLKRVEGNRYHPVKVFN